MKKQRCTFFSTILLLLFCNSGLIFPQQVPVSSRAKRNLSSSIIQNILDSVSLDQLLSTEKHITGEEPFWLHGHLDSIQTRYSYSPQIKTAQNYIQNKLESYGYAVELHSFPFSTFYDVDFVPGQKDLGWMTSVGKIFHTHDGGETWTVQFQSQSNPEIWSVFAVNANVVYAVGQHGLILSTKNGGELWNRQNAPSEDFYYGTYFISADTGWICGDNGVLVSTKNGGQTWALINDPVQSGLNDIFFISSNKGWAVGNYGSIIYTTDSGTTWAPQNSGLSQDLTGVYFLNENKGFAIGLYGSLLKTTDGGNSWQKIVLPITNHFYDLNFLDQQNGIIVGWNGASAKTTDGGIHWSVATNIFDENFNGCDFVDEDIIWAGGNNTVVKSTDFGLNWESKIGNVPNSNRNNIITTKVGLKYPNQFFIIGGHYDSTSGEPMNRAPGADDNGSGTAAVIEAARVLRNYEFNYSIRFILFSGEEQGLVGSWAYAGEAYKKNEQILGMINLDGIGYDSNKDRKFGIHSGYNENSQSFGNFILEKTKEFGLNLDPQFFTRESSGGSDHTSFWNYNYPAVFLSPDFQDFSPYYHSIEDRLDKMNGSYFLDISKLAIAGLASMAEMVQTDITNSNKVPSSFILKNPYPNPSHSFLQIGYSLRTPGKILLTIYDLKGRKIVEIVNQYQKSGSYNFTWNGKTNIGNLAAAGIYFLQLSKDGKTKSKKILLFR